VIYPGVARQSPLQMTLSEKRPQRNLDLLLEDALH